ncbi:uncharacterized protein MKZ38_001469 [Zalerion maritima]|uniref:F-box domain-containing protein n=1 Tax=Zalerion maritima TaxID=339359 RepID=A0AAD5WXH7_9PEZI|nr:uncharacterized protein MKZ38_001469 [Zalerion maritima]
MTNGAVNDVSNAFSSLTTNASPGPKSSSKPSLDSLNDHVLLAIVSFINTAKSVAALSKTCRRLHALVQDDGWRVFVHASFSNLSIPRGIAYPWNKVADSLTWQTRCWERKSIVLSNSDPNRGSRQGRQSVRFRPVLAARQSHKDGVELVVCGAGENIEGKFRGRLDGPGKGIGVSWHHLPGDSHGYVAGRDDITALALMDHEERGLCMVLGRAQGNLHILSASRDEKFGHKLCRLEGTDGSTGEGSTARAMRNRDAGIKSVDVSKTGHLVVANTSKDVLLYRYELDSSSTEDEDQEVQIPSMKPLHTKNLAKDETTEASLREYPLLVSKFLRNDLIGVAKYGALHYLDVTPTGLVGDTIGKSTMSDSSPSIRTIEPVSSGALTGGAYNLMLSSWLGGCIKLQDLRTPTPFDYVYRDSFDPYTSTMSLASYGASHFLAGTEEGWLKIFDYRMPRPYHHADGIPCSTRTPFPPPMSCKPTFPAKDQYPFPCNHIEGKMCRWHSQSQDVYYRPDFALGVTKLAPRDRGSHRTIWSLAKASDISPTFYLGLSGSVMEGNLYTYSEPSGTSPARSPRRPGPGHRQVQGYGDPLFGFWQPRSPRKKHWDEPFSVESWDYYKFDDMVHPETRTGEWGRPIKASPPGTKSPFGSIAKWHRLDEKYHSDMDYERAVTASAALPQ